MCSSLRHTSTRGHHGAAQAQEITAEQIETLDPRLEELRAQNPILDLFDFVVNGLEHRFVVVDDEVQDGIEDVVRPM